MKNIVAIVLTGLFTSLMGCAGGVSQMIDGNREQYVIDPSFNLFELQQAEFYFGGLSLLDDMPNGPQLNDIAVNNLIKSRKDLRWQTHHTFTAMVGDANAQRLQQFSRSNFASAEAKTALQNAQYPQSYVLYIRMLSNDVGYDNEETYHTDENNRKVVQRIYRANRFGSVQADVYDLSNQSHVWSAVLDHSISNETQTERQKGTILENVLTDVVDTMLVNPEPPSNEEFVAALFRKIGGQLPQRKCSEIGFTECIKRSARQN